MVPKKRGRSRVTGEVMANGDGKERFRKVQEMSEQSVFGVERELILDTEDREGM